MVGYHYGSPVYASLTKKRDMTKSSEEGVMQEIIETLIEWAYEIPEKGLEEDGASHVVWIVQTPFCAICYTNDRMYLPGDSMLEAEWLKKRKENHVQFSQARVLASREEFSSLRTLKVQAIQNIALGEVLLVEYGSIYEFHWWHRPQ